MVPPLRLERNAWYMVDGQMTEQATNEYTPHLTTSLPPEGILILLRRVPVGAAFFAVENRHRQLLTRYCFGRSTAPRS